MQRAPGKYSSHHLGSHAFVVGASFAVCIRQQCSGTLHCIASHIHKHEAAHGKWRYKVQGTRNLQTTRKRALVLTYPVLRGSMQSGTVVTCIYPSALNRWEGGEGGKEKRGSWCFLWRRKITYRYARSPFDGAMDVLKPGYYLGMALMILVFLLEGKGQIKMGGKLKGKPHDANSLAGLQLYFYYNPHLLHPLFYLDINTYWYEYECYLIPKIHGTNHHQTTQ